MNPSANAFEDCVSAAAWSVLPRARYSSPQGFDFPYAADTRLHLSAFSEMLYFLSRGPMSRGSIDFTADGDSTVVTVSVRFFYTTPEIIQHAKMYTLSRDEDNNGVGISTSPHLETLLAGANAFFSVHVQLPLTVEGEPISIDGLLAMTPLFSISLSDTMDIINFRSVTLQTANAPVYIHSLLAEVAEVTTSNAPIEVDICVTDSLDLLTSNGHVNAIVTLTSEEPDKLPSLAIQSSNSPITSRISLVSAAQGGSGSVFKVTAKTTNGPFNVTFEAAPLDSVLQFEASTSNAPARATLHPTYEGDLYVSSGGMMPPNVQYNGDAQDPAGRGRQRMVQTSNSSSRSAGVVEGRVRWGNEDHNLQGSVELTTSNAPITLVL